MVAIRRAISMFRPLPYVVAVATGCLIVLAGWALISIFVTPEDTLVIEVVPLTDAGQIRVQVEGEVLRPGVYLLASDSTYADAISAAGGYSASEVDDSSDPSRHLVDGEILIVSVTGDQAPSASISVNVNIAGIDELDTLPGIGPALAGRIIAYRDEHGPFDTVEELAEVSGISARMVADLRPHVVLDTP